MLWLIPQLLIVPKLKKVVFKKGIDSNLYYFAIHLKNGGYNFFGGKGGFAGRY